MQQINYRDKYYGSILDPLHGDIKLSEIEKWCISQPIFSRLRRVKQNTFLYYVFPSANHTRFEHSIGVMHLAGKIFDACKENFATGTNKLIKYKRPSDTSFFNLDKLEDREEIYYQELRLAALLHDLGHGPLSHLFDEFTVSSEKFLEIISNDQNLARYRSGFESLLKESEAVDHEIISCAFIFYLIDRLKKECFERPEKFSDDTKRVIDGVSAERIVKLVESKFPGLEDFFDRFGNIYTPFFSNIITGFPIDADRMDYLLRDSYFSGVTYGIYDTSRIFSSFLPFEKGGNIFLAYKESGMDSILRFIQSRSHLYNQVYFHKTNRSANSMLSFATAESKKKKVRIFDETQFAELLHLQSFYIRNSDEYFLADTVREKLCVSDLENSVLDELIDRKLFKRVFQFKIILSKKPFDKKANQLKEIKKKIDEKLFGLFGRKIFAVSDMYKNETFKDSAEKSIFVARKNSQGQYIFHQEWEEASIEFERADLMSIMIRIYLRRNFTSSSEFENFKRAVLESVNAEIEELENLRCG